MKIKQLLSLDSNRITNVATPTSESDAATKGYVDSASFSGVVDADATTKGKIQLAGDLTGTAASPAIATGAVTSAKIADGTITDTDVASANKDGTAATPSLRTLGTGSTQAAAGNDSRLSDSRTPSGSAGGDLTGTYPNPTLAAAGTAGTYTKVTTDSKGRVTSGTTLSASDIPTLTLAKISDAGTAASKNIPATGNASATEVVYGTDTRLTDSRTPSGSAGGDLTGTYPNPTIASGAVTSTSIADGTIVNGDISASAAIAYSKLSLTSSIVNADIATGAAIALSKLATDPLARANHTGTQTASTVSDFDTQVRTSRLDQMAAPTASVSMNSNKITSLATPTASTDAATKGYVDSAGGGVTVSDTAPSSPSAGALWFDSTSGSISIYYDSQWVAPSINAVFDVSLLQQYVVSNFLLLGV